MPSRTDRLLAAVAAEIEARRAQIDGAEDLRRAEVVLFFDERTGEPQEVLFRTESRRRIARQHDPARGTLAAIARW